MIGEIPRCFDILVYRWGEKDYVIIGSSGFVYLFKMADQKCIAILLGLILSIIACIQLHVTMLNVEENIGEYSKYEAIREYRH